MTVKDRTKQAGAPPTLLTVKQFVDEKKLAAISNMSVYFFQKDRWLHKGHPPGCPYKKFGKSVRYELGAALDWLDGAKPSDSPQVA